MFAFVDISVTEFVFSEACAKKEKRFKKSLTTNELLSQLTCGHFNISMPPGIKPGQVQL